MNKEIIEILNSLKPEIDYAEYENKDFAPNILLSSFDLVLLVSALEEKYNIVIDADDIVAENFESIDAIRNMVAKYL